ncbi:unnamed protein product [Closterium sp. Yama58-4]|nr:unnamed protein product [Closterium sp. Yama58-4]
MESPSLSPRWRVVNRAESLVSSLRRVASNLTFSWVNPLVALGARRQLSPGDLLPLPADVEPRVCGLLLWTKWEEERAAGDAVRASRGDGQTSDVRREPSQSDGDSLIDGPSSRERRRRSAQRGAPSLLRCLVAIFGAEYLLIGGIKLVNDALAFAGPLLLHQLVSVLDGPPTLTLHHESQSSSTHGTHISSFTSSHLQLASSFTFSPFPTPFDRLSLVSRRLPVDPLIVCIKAGRPMHESHRAQVSAPTSRPHSALPPAPSSLHVPAHSPCCQGLPRPPRRGGTALHVRSPSVPPPRSGVPTLPPPTASAAFLGAHYSYRLARMGLKLRAAIATCVFAKVLAVSAAQRGSFEGGEVQTLMSVDADRLVNLVMSLHDLWGLPLQILVALLLLYWQVSYAFLAGLAVVLLLIPVNRWLAGRIGEASKQMMASKDARVQAMQELLDHVAAVRAMAMEGALLHHINAARHLELSALAVRKYLDAWCVYFWACTPVLFSLATFSSLLLLGRSLNAPVVFTSLALFNVLLGPLNSFPWVINGIVEALISVRRLEAFLCIPTPPTAATLASAFTTPPAASSPPTAPLPTTPPAANSSTTGYHNSTLLRSLFPFLLRLPSSPLPGHALPAPSPLAAPLLRPSPALVNQDGASQASESEADGGTGGAAGDAVGVAAEGATATSSSQDCALRLAATDTTCAASPSPPLAVHMRVVEAGTPVVAAEGGAVGGAVGRAVEAAAFRCTAYAWACQRGLWWPSWAR